MSGVFSYPPDCSGMLVTYDGSFLKNVFGGVLYLFVYRNANKELTALAFGVAGQAGERGEDSAWMMTNFRVCFPQLAIIVQDEGSGITSKTAVAALEGITLLMGDSAVKRGISIRENVFLGLCFRHVVENIGKRHKGKDVFNIVKCVFLARTMESLTRALEMATRHSEGLHAELESKKHLFALYYRLETGLLSRGVITQNNSESMNFSSVDARKRGPFSLIILLAARTIELHAERSRHYQDCQDAVPAAIAKDVQALIAGTKKYKMVTVHEATERVLRADIQKAGSSVVCVRIARESNSGTTITCPCRHWEDEGIPCSRAYFLIGYAAIHLGLAGVWDIQSRELIHKSLSMACLQDAYKPGIRFPSLSISVSPPRKILNDQMENFGSLACYPGSFLPRKEYETSKKIKTKDRNRRMGGWKEKSKGGIRDEGDDDDDDDKLSEEQFGLDLDQLRQVGQSVSTILSADVDVFAGDKRKMRPMTCQRCGSNDHTAPTCGNEDISFLLHKLRVFPLEEKSQAATSKPSADSDPTRFLSFAALCVAYPHLEIA